MASMHFNKLLVGAVSFGHEIIKNPSRTGPKNWIADISDFNFNVLLGPFYLEQLLPHTVPKHHPSATLRESTQWSGSVDFVHR